MDFNQHKNLWGREREPTYDKSYFIGQERLLVDYANEKPVSKQRISKVTDTFIISSYIIWAKKHV
ncbi:hypothetical protein ACUIAK_02145 [Bacillus cytotoxicus]